MEHTKQLAVAAPAWITHNLKWHQTICYLEIHDVPKIAVNAN